MKFNKNQWAWISYDFANSAFHLLIPTILFPLFFKSVINTTEKSDLYWSLTISIPVLIAGIIAPFLGAFLDKKSTQKRSFVFTVLGAIAFNFLLGFIGIGNVTIYTIVFILCMLFFSLSQFTYDSFIVTHSTEKQFAKLSGYGWGIGYLGGILCILPIMALISNKTLPSDYQTYQLCFIIVASFYLVFSLPSLFLIKPVEVLSETELNPVRKVFFSLRKFKENRNIFIFVIAFYLINDGLSTLVYFTSIFASETVGLTSKEILMSFLLVQLVAVPATIIFCSVSEKIGYLKVFVTSVFLWIIIGFLFYIVSTTPQFYVLSVIVGLVIGTTPAMARAILAKYLQNRKDFTEFFGFNAFASRASSIIGPLLFGIISVTTGSKKIAILSISLFFISGLVTLWFLKDAKELEVVEG
ncbi:MAG: MFS transporter [Pyrinomonadaceae bacterium]